MQIQEFIDRWRNTQASERANKDSYLKELCRILGVPEPDGKTGDCERDRYCFEADAVVYDEDGRRHVGSMDLYREGCFVLEAKQSSQKGSFKKGTARWGTPGWNLAMTDAAGQAFGYARTLDEPPPFVIVADIGQCFDLYACFDGSGAYRAFPNAQKHRLWVKELSKHADMLRAIWVDPHSLDPRRHSERVTQEVASALAELASGLEDDGHDSQLVAKFLMRCIFTMFAEDIGLLQDNVFSKYLERQWVPDPRTFKDGVEELWSAMNAGKRFYVLGKLLRFNGGLFADPVALQLTSRQLTILAKAAKHDWSEVEPAIFGTLIERALDPKERHSLGAHFTPTDYVRRLVRPTLEEPLRSDWEIVRVKVRELVPAGVPAKASNLSKARAAVQRFHEQLCATRVLDPACGTGNFLFVAFQILKQLESEVLATLYDLGQDQLELSDDLTVTPKQFLGLEVRAGSKEIAELVLWIGYLQWHHKMFGGTKKPPEPILQDYKNIECRDAVLAFDSREVARDKNTGAPVTTWDGVTMKRHAATGALVPDERFTTPLLTCTNPRIAQWPKADYVIGNPPFIGNKRMRLALGDDYVAALRKLHADVPETADYVMYWWSHAASLVASGEAKRFGFITTNSITQTFNRQVVQHHLSRDLKLTFAVPDHPWTDAADGAAVRVAMTTVEKGAGAGRLLRISKEVNGCALEVSETSGSIQPDLRIGARVAAAVPLAANRNLSFQGVIPLGDGFRLSAEELARITAGSKRERVATRRFVIGRDLVQRPEERWVIDFHGLTEDQARQRYPRLFQHALDTVKPERDQNRRETRRKKWWLFGENAPKMRRALHGLNRYIATVETSKFKPFVFIDGDVLPDHKVYAVASDDAFVLGVLSSRVHSVWCRVAGGTLEDRPTWTNTTCFLPFPFPQHAEPHVKVISKLAEDLDAHRKQRQLLHPSLTLTGIYNVLEKLRTGQPLSKSDRAIHELALVSTLGKMHDDLDAAVLAAYGWAHDLADDDLLDNLVALNSERAAEERMGIIRWLRRDFQEQPNAKGQVENVEHMPQTEQLVLPWPNDLPRQVAAVRDWLTATDAPSTANDVAAAHVGATPQTVLSALDTLVALGMAASFDSLRGRCWKGLARATGERTIQPGAGKVSSRPPSGDASTQRTG